MTARVNLLGPNGARGPVIDVDKAYEQGHQIVVEAAGRTGVFAVRTTADTVSVLSGPWAGTEWTDVFIQDSRDRAMSAAPMSSAPSGSGAEQPRATNGQWAPAGEQGAKPSAGGGLGLAVIVGVLTMLANPHKGSRTDKVILAVVLGWLFLAGFTGAWVLSVLALVEVAVWILRSRMDRVQEA